MTHEYVVKGVVLSAGRGSRLYPMTSALSKEVLPVYDKPMIYYAIARVMMAGIREIMIIANPDNRPVLEALLGDGSQWGVRFHFSIQADPKGIAHALTLAGDFVRGQPCLLILGDNILIGPDLDIKAHRAAGDSFGCSIFAVKVGNPEQYGVVEFDEDDLPKAIVEKPVNPRSSWAVPGVYLYDSSVFDIASRLTPSRRGELEITDVNAEYLRRGRLAVSRLGPEHVWFDAGTPASFLEAANHVHALTARDESGILVPEIVAHSNGWINSQQLAELGRSMLPSGYGRRLISHAER